MIRDNIEHGWIGTEDKEGNYEATFHCSWCGEDIYEGDEYYNFDGEKVCYECVRDCKSIA